MTIPGTDCIRINESIYIVDRKAEIKEGDHYIDSVKNIGSAYKNNAGFYKDCLKIIYTINCSLDGVKRIEVKLEEEILADEKYNPSRFYPTALIQMHKQMDRCDAFVTGFRACKSKCPFTEDQMFDFAEWMGVNDIEQEPNEDLFYFKNDTYTKVQIMEKYLESRVKEISSITITEEGERITGVVNFK